MFRKSIVMLLVLVCAAPAFSAEAPATTAPQPTTEQVMTQFREDLQAAAADVMAKGLTLTADQAAKFWPMFATFQKERAAILDEQLKALIAYGENYKTMNDAAALAYVNSLLERDQRVHNLRLRYLTEFQTVVPTRVAARAIQLDRRLGLVAQVKVSSQVPLIP